MEHFYKAIRFISVCFLLLVITPVKAQVITTIVGAGAGDGGLATAANLNYPYAVAVDATGNIYIADQSNNRIRKVNTSGVISTIAGTGTSGFSGDGLQATAAELNSPSSVILDASGNVLISDAGNNRVRKINTSGIISTIAGSGPSGYNGDSIPATAAELYSPQQIALDASGNLYIADYYNQRIRKVNTAGLISTIAGDGNANFYGDGKPAIGSELNGPYGVAVDNTGIIYIADMNNNRIREIDLTGNMSTVAGNGLAGYLDGSGSSSQLNGPSGLYADASGNLYIADQANNRIRMLDNTNTVSTIAGDGNTGYVNGPVGSAEMYNPTGVTVDNSGNVFVADYYNNSIREISAGTVTTVAGGPANNYFTGDGSTGTNAILNNPVGVARDKSGNIYFIDQTNQRVRKYTISTRIITTLAGNGTAGFTGDNGPATNAELNYPGSIAIDDSNNIYIADAANYRIRRITNLTGIITTYAGNGNNAYTGENGLADTGAVGPVTGLATDTAGNVYFTDNSNDIIRKITKATGLMNTIAGIPSNGGYNGDGLASATQLTSPSGIAVDKAGNVYILDGGNVILRKLKIASDSIVTIAGQYDNYSTPSIGPKVLATSIGAFYSPSYVALDTTGNIYVTDASNNNIVKIDKYDSLVVIAGAGGVEESQTYNGDNIMANTAYLYNSQGIAVDDSGNVFFADQGNQRIREIRVAGPNIISQPPTYSYGCLGWPATLAIGVQGTGVTYQWQIDSMKGTGWANVPNTGAYSGANKDTLHIGTVTTYSVQYQCIINSGYVTSSPSYFSAITRPTISFTSNQNLNDSVCPSSYVQVEASGGLTYKWSDSTTGVFGNFYPNVTTTYSVAAQTQGCIVDTTIKILVVKHILKALALPGNTVCRGQSVTLYGSGGSAYSWNRSTGNTYTFNADTSGSYIMNGIEGGPAGCNDSALVTIKVNPIPVVSASSTKDSICEGASVTLTASGASTYSWSNGITNGVGFTPSASAVYYVTGTDANGCSASASLTEVVNPLPIVTGTASPDAVCQGASLSLSGNGAASYTWSGGVTNGIAFVPASSGSYSVTGKDKNGCLGSAAVNITVNPLPIISASAFPSAILCQGSSLALFGAGGASYSWSNGVNNGVSFTPPASTTYTVTGIDANGCTASANIAVTVHHKVVPTLTSNNTTCGLKNGSASASGSNGIAPYTYSWSTVPASSTSFIDSLAPGTYVVTVSDSANCASSSAVSIGSSTAPILSVSTTNSNCGFLGTGSASVAVTGGNAPYHYMWNNGDTLASNYNLRAATYIITVTDVNGCSSFAPAIVSNLNGPKIATQSIVNVKCNGSPTGAITVAVSGGNPPYHYNWSNGSSSSAISALFAGPYQLVVFDADSCTSVESFVITQPNALSVSSASVKADCGVSNGSASVAVTGGLAPYSYSWNNGVSANVNAAVPAGVYYVTIIDANGCADSSLIAVSNKTGPSLALSLSANASCGSGGLISVVATGGSLPYAYHWSNGVTASSVSNVPAGNYYVTVTDGKGCVGSADTSVSEVVPAALSLCMVTVDPLVGKHNYIIWDKSLAKKISHYNIYKESTSAGVYFKIDSVPFDSAGIYVDLLSDATVRSWRYKISQVDSCGNESSLSPAHKTMHLTVNQGVGHNINLIWDNYEGLNFSTYYVYRDTIASKYTLIDSIPNNIFTYTDNKFPYSTKPFLYRIGISNPGGCAPAIEAINYNASKSNTGNFTFNPTAGIAAIDAANAGLSVFPNPNNGVFTFALNTDKGSKELNLSVVNTLGQVVISHVYEDVPAAFTKTLDLSSLAKGVYFLKLQSDNNTLYNKVVIQ